MLVYRVCENSEVEKILNNKSFKNIGNTFKANEKLNTHLYEKDKKYIHFFEKKDSIFFKKTTKDMCICTYDIPNYLLENYCGTGFYLDRFSFRYKENVVEYAIESQYIEFSYLVKAERILEDIDIEDYMYDSMASKIDLIYSNDCIKKDKKLLLKTKIKN